MKQDISQQKQELSCVNCLPVIRYMEKQCGVECAREAIESLGLPLAYLRSKRNWVSFDYYNQLLDTLVEVTGDELAPYKAPLHSETSKIFDYLEYAAHTLFWHRSPGVIYRMILGFRFYRRWTKIGQFRIIEASRDSVTVDLQLGDAYPQTRHNCLSIQGLLASVPAEMGMKPAHVEELQCAAYGHDSCVYRLSWQPLRNRFALAALLGGGLIAAAMVLGPFAFSTIHYLTAGLGFASIVLFLRNIQQHRILRSEEEVNAKRNDYLVDTLQSVEDSYAQLYTTTQRLEETTKTIDTILASLPAIVVIFSIGDMRIRFANQAFADAFAIPRAVGEKLCSVIPFEDPTVEHIYRLVAEASRDHGPPQLHETRIGTRVMEYSLFLLPADHGEEPLTGLIMTDVTTNRLFEQKMLTSHRLLALGRIAGGIAHEINNPLYALLANAEEIAEIAPKSSPVATYANEIVDLSFMISEVIRELSSYSKSMRHQRMVLLDLNEVIEHALKLACYGLNIMEIEIHRELTPLPPFHAVPGELQQVFINLFTNAIQAMDRAGTLTVATSEHNGRVTARVSDTGSGIPADQLPHIFDYYYTTKGDSGGSGQGLAIVQKLVHNNHGRIEVHSTPGKGTEFLLGFSDTTEEQNQDE